MRYVVMPATQMRDPDDRILLNDRGKPHWRAFVDFRNKEVRKRFSDQVLAALRSVHPELFSGESGQ